MMIEDPHPMTQSWLTVAEEVAGALSAVDPARFQALVALCGEPGGRWFFSGQGRSGLVAQMAAMRFMHAGFASHFVGEATAPSVRSGDHLVIVSGSGATPVSLGYARIAKAEGARVALLTTDPASPIADVADIVVPVPVGRTRQFGGSLFEQSCLLVLDAVIFDLVERRADAHTDMAFMHTNLQ